MFSALMNDTIAVLKQNGQSIEKVKASVQKNKIFIDRSDFIVDSGDLIQRKMSKRCRGNISSY